MWTKGYLLTFKIFQLFPEFNNLSLRDFDSSPESHGENRIGVTNGHQNGLNQAIICILATVLLNLFTVIFAATVCHQKAVMNNTISSGHGLRLFCKSLLCY